MIRIYLQAVLFLNIVTFLIVASVRFSNRTHLQFVTVIWGLALVAVSYMLTDSLGASSPTFEILGIDLPWYYIAPLSISIAASVSVGERFATLQKLLVFGVCCVFSLLTDDSIIVQITNQEATDVLLLIGTFLTVFSLCITVVAPLPFFWTKGESILWSVFRITKRQIKEHWKVLLRGLGWFVLVFAATNIWVEGNIANLYLIKAPGTFLRDALFTTFYLVLIRHFVFIALAKYVIDVLFPDQPTSTGEIFLFACLLAGFQFYLPLGLIVREFLFGLIFGYWYLKTRSLSYGIVLRSLSMIFT